MTTRAGGPRSKRTTRLKAFRRALRALVAMRRSRSPRRRHRAPQAHPRHLAPHHDDLPPVSASARALTGYHPRQRSEGLADHETRGREPYERMAFKADRC